MGLEYKKYVSNWKEKDGVYSLYQKVYLDIKNNLKRKVKQIGRYPTSKNFDKSKYYLIAMRVGHGKVKDYPKKGENYVIDDYHFLVRHNDGSWSHKPGTEPSQNMGKGGYDFPSKQNWDIPFYKKGVKIYLKNFYNSATYYLAIRKD